MIDESPIENADLSEDQLVEECTRLLDCMEERLASYSSAGHKTSTGSALFWPVRGLDEINFIGTTFRKRWSELRIRTPNPPAEIRKRAERVVESFLETNTKVVLPGLPGVGDRRKLRDLLGLSAYDS